MEYALSLFWVHTVYSLLSVFSLSLGLPSLSTWPRRWCSSARRSPLVTYSTDRGQSTLRTPVQLYCTEDSVHTVLCILCSSLTVRRLRSNNFRNDYFFSLHHRVSRVAALPYPFVLPVLPTPQKKVLPFPALHYLPGYQKLSNLTRDISLV